MQSVLDQIGEAVCDTAAEDAAGVQVGDIEKPGGVFRPCDE
jgi:hypothetical protein